MALRMTHPDIDGEATCVDLAQFSLLEGRGWVLVTDDAGDPAETTDRVPGGHIVPTPVLPDDVVDPDPAPRKRTPRMHTPTDDGEPVDATKES